MTNQDMILVLGATGTTGRRVVRRLRDAGHPVRPASRSGEPRFDWTDPSSWRASLAGVTAMYLMAPHDQPVESDFVRLAVEHGVGRVVLLSSRAIEAMGDERLMAAEETVRACGAQWTILRPDWFDQNFDEGFFRDGVLAGEIAMPVGDARQCFVDADDIADVAVAALTGAGHAGRTYEITGPEALSFGEAAEILTESVGRPVRHLGATDDYRAVMLALGVPAEQVAGEIAAFGALRDLGDGQPTGTVRLVTGHDPKSFAAYAADAAARGAWRS
ncbi:NAD(P)H-binding protein [Micromonospora andamanensis]|uniref:NAD(P)H-binding protein n=1 Tax=Micromonospora andamanensis TaxID=1287068 RepID=UPI001A371ED1|nr:NAD(P)H-binding protein [Micromonospora andamanensis]GIJ40126.1 NmrA family protein [Micromonospora andamanensis]